MKLDIFISSSARKLIPLGVVFSLLALVSGPVSADPGDGIRIAGAKVVPSVDLYTKYETNPGRLASEQGPQGDASIVTRLGLDFRKAGADLGLDVSSSFVYDHFFGLASESTKEYSAFTGDVNLDLQANKRSEFPVDVSAALLRVADPQVGSLDQKLEHTLLSLGLKTGYNPGGGALKNTLSADYSYDYFDRGSSESSEASAKRQDYQRITAKVESLYKFLPKTGVFLNFSYSNQQFPYSDSTPFEFTIGQEDGEGTVLTGQNQAIGIWKAYTGLTGMLTQKMTLLVSLGVNSTSLSTAAQNAGASLDEGLTSLAGNLQLNWQNSSTSKTFLQLSRSVSPASLFKYVDVLGGAIGGELRLLGDLALSAKASLSYLGYGVPVVSGVDNRSDLKLGLDMVASYSINAGLVFAVVNQLEVLSTSFSAPNGINPSYTANSTFLRVAFRY